MPATMSPPTYAPSDGNTKAGARGCTATPKSLASVSGSSCVVTVKGAIDSGSGSIPRARCIIVALPQTVIS